MTDVQEIGYEDERLADGSVCRRFDTGRTEWRTRLADGRVGWRDASGSKGVDELLGDGVLKRTHDIGNVEYAREQGYGRTAWKGGRIVTVNRTSIGGRVGGALSALGGAALLGAVLPPPESLSPEEEEALRQQPSAPALEADVDGDWNDDDGDFDGGDGDFG
jgi:hypothetical protein